MFFFRTAQVGSKYRFYSLKSKLNELSVGTQESKNMYVYPKVYIFLQLRN